MPWMRVLSAVMSINQTGMIDWLVYINPHADTQLLRPSYGQYVLHETQNLITDYLEVHVEMLGHKV